MSILAAVIGSIQTAGGGGGGGGSKSASWSSIAWEPIQEGETNYVNINFTNWDNSTVYWTVVGAGNSYIGPQVTPYNGMINPGTGNSSQNFSFTFNPDATTDGNLTYYVFIGSSAGQQDLVTGGPFTCRDSSKTPALLLDLDPANYNPSNVNLWPDSTSNHYDCMIYNYGYYNESYSGISGGVMYFNGGTFTDVGGLQTGVNYSTLTASIWFKPEGVSSTQTLIAKEFLFKVRINSDGKIGVLLSSDGSSWALSSTTSGSENLTANTWNNIILTVSSTDNVRLYLNGLECANFSQTVLGYNNNKFTIGMYNYNDSNNDFFTGLIGEVKLYNYPFTSSSVINEFNSSAARYGLSTIGRSTSQNGTSGSLEVTNTTSDWALGSTYTIEFWCKHGGTTSPSGLHTVMGQGAGQVGIDVGFIDGYLLLGNQPQTEVIEAPLGTWTHVAIVSDGTNTKVYYNGILKLTRAAIAFNNSSDTLFIGKRGSNNFQYFNGNLTEIRINNTALYSGNYFTPPGTVTNVSGTKLCISQLGPYDDISTSDHPVNYSMSFVTDVPKLQSMNFVYSSDNSCYLYSVSGNEHNNLGTSWTIEFWIKANNNSHTAQGGIWGLFNQGGWSTTNSINIALTDGKLAVLSGSNANDDIRFAEPTPGVWTHVAIVNVDGTQVVYYNGNAQTQLSGTMGSANYANGTDPLYIGRLAPVYGGQFNGKLANIRISAAAKYFTNFTPAVYYVESDTKLFLGRYDTFHDTTGHYGIATSNISTSSDYPGA